MGTIKSKYRLHNGQQVVRPNFQDTEGRILFNTLLDFNSEILKLHQDIKKLEHENQFMLKLIDRYMIGE